MKTMSKSLGFSAKLISLSIPLLFNQAYAFSGSCGTLHLLIVKSIYKNYKISSDSPVVNHGKYKGCEKKMEGGNCIDFKFNQISGQYGPDADIEFKERNGNKTAKIRIQQNYCYWEGGNITVQPKKGLFEYKIYPGTHSSQIPGLVAITSIKAQ